MALYSGRLLMRGGNEANFNPDKMLPREWAVSTDKKIVRICVAPGICIRMATYDAFEEDMAKIENILKECQTIQEVVVRINAEVSQNADAVAEYTAQAKQYRDDAKRYRDEAFYTTPDGYSNLVQNVASNTVKIDTIIEKANLGIKETASGEEIHLTDSAEGKAVEFALFGKARQNTTSGKNLLKNTAVSKTINEVVFTVNSGGIASPNPDYPQYIEVSGESYNLLENTAESRTINGVEFVVNEDKSLTVNGTATADAVLWIYEPTGNESFIGEKYILSGCPSGGSDTKYLLGTYRSDTVDGKDGSKKDFGNGVEGTWLNNGSGIKSYVYIKVSSGITVDNLTFYPMIRKASVKNDRYMPYGKGSVEVKSIGDDTYEPYKETTATIPTPNGLAGIKVSSGGNYTDSNGQQWICDEIVKYADGSGEYIKRVGKVVFDGSEDEVWYIDYKGRWVSKSLVEAGKTLTAGELANALCDRYQLKTGGQTYERNEGISVNNVTVIIYDSNYSTSDKATWTSYLAENPTTLYYELSEPIRTPLTAEQLAEIEKVCTFYPITNISNDFDCGMKVTYLADSKNYIDNKLVLQAKAREEEMMSMFLLLPEETQAAMIENDTNNLLLESEE